MRNSLVRVIAVTDCQSCTPVVIIEYTLKVRISYRVLWLFIMRCRPLLTYKFSKQLRTISLALFTYSLRSKVDEVQT